MNASWILSIIMNEEQINENLGLHIELKIWHPNCWTLEITEDTSGGLFGHGVYRFDESVKGRFTIYADTESELDTLIQDIRNSKLTNSVWLMDHQYDIGTETPTPGNATRSLLVEYNQEHSISDSLVSKGLIPDKPVWIHGGHEYWTVIVDKNRAEVQDCLDEVREEMAAEIDIRQISTDGQTGQGLFRTDILTERQREIFDIARQNGYYNWPREVSAAELSDQLNISKATFVEHLRKAEIRIIDSIP